MSTSLKLLIGNASSVALVDDVRIADAVSLEAAPPDFWEALSGADKKGSGWEIVLAPPDTYEVRFPDPPRFLSKALREHAPVRPEHLVWSAVSDDDGAAVTIAKRDRLAEIESILHAHGLRVHRFTSLNGNVLSSEALLGRSATVTLAIALLALAITPFNVAAGIWAMRSTALAPAPSKGIGQGGGDVAHPTLAHTIATVAQALPQDVRVVSMERRIDGRTSLTIDSQAPATLRTAVRRNAALGNWRVISQESHDGGETRLILRGTLR